MCEITSLKVVVWLSRKNDSGKAGDQDRFKSEKKRKLAANEREIVSNDFFV